MKVCFPVQNDEGLESAVFNHFGSAPAFVLVDTDAHTLSTISNGDRHHAKGACNPLKALEGHAIDAVVVGGIGGGALTRLNQAGIKVFRARPVTIRENLELYRDRSLEEYSNKAVCSGHSHGGGCSHH